MKGIITYHILKFSLTSLTRWNESSTKRNNQILLLAERWKRDAKSKGPPKTAFYIVIAQVSTHEVASEAN